MAANRLPDFLGSPTPSGASHCPITSAPSYLNQRDTPLPHQAFEDAPGTSLPSKRWGPETLEPLVRAQGVCVEVGGGGQASLHIYLPGAGWDPESLSLGQPDQARDCMRKLPVGEV